MSGWQRFDRRIRYVIGRTTLESGYEFQYDLYVEEEERSSHRLYVRLKRYF